MFKKRGEVRPSGKGGPARTLPRRSEVHIGRHELRIRGADDAYQLFVAFGDSGTCHAAGSQSGDFDADGVSMCAGDCDETRADVAPGKPELCHDGLDSNCDTRDDPSGRCTTALPGVCSAGYTLCHEQSTLPECQPNIAPGARSELCGNLVDEDCDGATDEQACRLPNGGNCDEAIDITTLEGQSISGAIIDPVNDGSDCGSGPEAVYYVAPARAGNLYLELTPTGANGLLSRVEFVRDVCGGSYYCMASGTSAPVDASRRYYLNVGGELGAGFVLRYLVTVCGDGVLQGAEQCDDGNLTSGDGCSALCVLE